VQNRLRVVEKDAVISVVSRTHLPLKITAHYKGWHGDIAVSDHEDLISGNAPEGSDSGADPNRYRIMQNGKRG